jgi:hypothetical protein
MVPANDLTFSKIRKRLGEEDEDGKEPSVEKLGKILGGIARGPMTNMLEGRKVSYGLLANKVMPALDRRWPKGVWEKFTLNDLIKEDLTSRIPDDPEVLRKFIHGYYEDHNRHKLGTVGWFKEDLIIKALKHDEAGNVCLEGTIRNQFKDTYSFVLTRLHNHLCVFRAIQQNGTNCFAGTYTHLYRGIGFDLRLMSWEDGSGVPTSGKNLVVVGIDNKGLLHIRIFDAGGNRVTDTNETKLPSTQAGVVSALKQQLPGLLPPHALTRDDKARLISEATSIVDLAHGTLCGVWCGIDIAGRPAIYRGLLSSIETELTPRELNAICKAVGLSGGS